MKLVAISGGIGSGKSVVSHLLTLLGYGVYDCDSRAKLLMNRSEDVKRELREAFGDDVITPQETVNRDVLSKIIFGNAEALKKVNSIVHPRVVAEIMSLAGKCNDEYFFFETALPQESGLDKLADAVWLVTAPVEKRIERVIKRSGLTREQVMARIASQDYSNIKNNRVEYIINDENKSLTNQLLTLLTKSL